MKVTILSTPDSEYTFKKGERVKFYGGGTPKEQAEKLSFEPDQTDFTNPTGQKYPKGIPVQSVKYNVDPAKYKRAKDLYEKAKASKDPKDVALFQKTFHEDFPDIAQPIVSGAPTTTYGVANKIPNTNLKSNEEGLWGPRTEQYMADLDKLYNNGTPQFTPIATPKDTKLSGESKNTGTDPYKQNDIISPISPKFKGDEFDYTQIAPEIYGLVTDPGIKTWTKKFSPKLMEDNTLNIQANLNDNQSDAYSAVQNLSGGSGTRNANISNIFAQKYKANNSIYQNKFNFDSQSHANVNNQNNQIINQAENINFQRAKQQFDERDVAKEHEYARKNSIYTSLVNKKAKYDQDQGTKKFWFDILSKNYIYENGSLKYAPETSTLFGGLNAVPPSPTDNLRVESERTRTTTGKKGDYKTITKKRVN